MKIVFFGASKFVLPLIAMLQKQHDLQLVITTETDLSDTVPTFCKSNNIVYQSIKKFDDSLLQMLKQTNAELGVLAYFGLFLPKNVLDLFPKGILNIHPSLLPKYRGPTPVQSAILNGDTETGVTIIKLDKDMDHGPMLAQENATISPQDTTETLHEVLFHKGTVLLEKIIPQYETGTSKSTEQSHEQATYTKRDLTRQDGFIDLEYPLEKTQFDRMIRAYYPWPAVWTKTKLNGKEVRIKFLPENKLQVEGKKPMSFKDFLNGYPEMREKIEKIL